MIERIISVKKIYCAKSPNGELDVFSIGETEDDAWTQCTGCYAELDGYECRNDLIERYKSEGWTIVEVEMREKNHVECNSESENSN